jgi:hypothetical protein
MAYRFRDPTPVLDNLLGTEPTPGGQAYFYEIGTSTPKDTFQDYGLTTPNTNPIILTSAGRFPFPVWMDGDYTYELKTAAGASVINPTDIRPEIAPGEAIPDPLGHDGEYLTVVAGEVAWSGPVWGLPDPTGSAGNMVVVDSSGTTYVLQAQPVPEDPDITITSTTNTIGETGNTSKRFEQTGTGSAPASGAHTTQVAVTFAEAFTSTPIVIPIPNVASVASGGYLVAVSVISKSATGFTVKFDTNESSGAEANIINPVTFDWIAIGRKTVT